jgi:hypothetical protein
LPTWVLPRFFSAVCSIGSVWWSSYTTKEIPPTEEELKKIKEEPLGLFTFTDIFSAIKDMPKVMAASIGLFVSMVCLVLLLAKLIKKRCLFGIQPQKI